MLAEKAGEMLCVSILMLATRTRALWSRLRALVHVRPIALYWQGLTAYLYAEGGIGRKRDYMAFVAEFSG